MYTILFFDDTYTHNFHLCIPPGSYKQLHSQSIYTHPYWNRNMLLVHFQHKLRLFRTYKLHSHCRMFLVKYMHQHLLCTCRHYYWNRNRLLAHFQHKLKTDSRSTNCSVWIQTCPKVILSSFIQPLLCFCVSYDNCLVFNSKYGI